MPDVREEEKTSEYGFPLTPCRETPRVSELEHVVPFDLETSGLDEQNDQILEVHMRMGAIRPGGYTDYCAPEGLTIVLPILSNILEWHPAVVEMHTKSGLLAEAHAVNNKVQKTAAYGTPDYSRGLIEKIRNADESLCRFIDRHWTTAEGAEPPKWTLLGNSVHFDLRFARRLFPKFAKRLSHRVIDVSAIRIFTEALGLPYQKDEPAHRAAADVAHSIKSFERYQTWVRDTAVGEFMRGTMARGGA